MQENGLGNTYGTTLKNIGQLVMVQVFFWAYPGDLSRSIREYLFRVPSYSNRKYNKFFDEQKQKLERNSTDNESFDISLLYSLLQVVCEDKWNTQGPRGSSLGDLLKYIKQERNTHAHAQNTPQLSHQEFETRLQQLQETVCSIYELCAIKFNWVGDHEKDRLVNDVKNQVRWIKIRNSKLLKFLICFAKNVVRLFIFAGIFLANTQRNYDQHQLATLVSRARSEFLPGLREFYAIDFAPWLDLGVSIKNQSESCMRLVMNNDYVPARFQS